MRKLKSHRLLFILEYLEPRVLLSDTPMAVTQFSVEASGFAAQFNQAVDATVLNLYDTEAGILGPADVSIEGAAQGSIKGSLILTDNRLTFVKSGGVLAPDVYTVTMRSASDGIKGVDGSFLDGNNDGISGDNYVNVFTVAPAPPMVIRIADVARGPAQSIISDSGLSVTLSDGVGVTDVRFSINYDPALLKIMEALAGSSLPAGTQLQSDLSQPGIVSIHISSPSPMGAGPVALIRLIADVPANAVYARSSVLDLNLVSVNNGVIPVSDDDGVQVVANFGDATGNQRYSALDGTRTLRVVAGLDSGFAPYPTIDPAIIADITGSNSLSSLDGTRILQEVVGQDRPEIPDIVPVILVGLVEDTGISDTDLVTSNPAVTGSVSDDGTIVRFMAGLDDMLPENFVDVTADLQGSAFTFTRERLEQILGAPLSDGPHTLHLHAVDSDGIGPAPGGSTPPVPAPGSGGLAPVFNPGAPTPVFNPGGPGPVFDPGAPSPVFNPGSPSPTPDESTAPNLSIVEMTFILETELEMTMASGFSAGFELETAGDGFTDAVLFTEYNSFIVQSFGLTDSSAPGRFSVVEQREIRADFSLQSEQQLLELNSLGASPWLPVSSLPDLVGPASYETLAVMNSQPAPRIYQVASLSKSVNEAPVRVAGGDVTTSESVEQEPTVSPTRSPRKETPRLKPRLLSWMTHIRRLR